MQSPAVPLSRAGRVAGIVLLAGLGAQGVWSAFGQWGGAATLGQVVQTVAQVLYGGMGLVGAGLAVARRPLRATVRWAWALAVTVAAGMAPVVWGGAGRLSGLASAAVGFVIAGAILWLVRRGVAA